MKKSEGVTVNNIYVTINVEACKCGRSEPMLTVLKRQTEGEKLINIVENINYNRGGC